MRFIIGYCGEKDKVFEIVEWEFFIPMEDREPSKVYLYIQQMMNNDGYYDQFTTSTFEPVPIDSFIDSVVILDETRESFANENTLPQ